MQSCAPQYSAAPRGLDTPGGAPTSPAKNLFEAEGFGAERSHTSVGAKIHATHTARRLATAAALISERISIWRKIYDYQQSQRRTRQ